MAYVRFGSLPKVEGVLYAIKPAVVAIVIQALLKLGVRACARCSCGDCLAGGRAELLGVSPVLVLVFAGLLSMASLATKNRLLGAAGLPKALGLPKVAVGAMAVAAVGAAFPVGIWRLFLSFLK